MKNNMKIILIILAILTLPIQVKASVEFLGEEWFTEMSTKEIVLEVLVCAAIIYDWGQTKTLRYYAPDVADGNTFLEKYPSQGRVDTVIGFGLLAHIVWIKAAPDWVRKPFQVGTLIFEFNAIDINNSYARNRDYPVIDPTVFNVSFEYKF